MQFNNNQGQQNQQGFNNNQGGGQGYQGKSKDSYIRTRPATTKTGETFPSISMIAKDMAFGGQPATAWNLTFTSAFKSALAQYGVDLEGLLVQLGEAVILSGNRAGYTPKNLGQPNTQNQNPNQSQGGFNGQPQQAGFNQPQQQVQPAPQQPQPGFNGQAGNTGGTFTQNTAPAQQYQPPVQPNLDGIPF